MTFRDRSYGHKVTIDGLTQMIHMNWLNSVDLYLNKLRASCRMERQLVLICVVDCKVLIEAHIRLVHLEHRAEIVDTFTQIRPFMIVAEDAGNMRRNVRETYAFPPLFTIGHTEGVDRTVQEQEFGVLRNFLFDSLRNRLTFRMEWNGNYVVE